MPAKPARRRSSVPPQILEQYVVAVADWDLQWLFSIADPKRETGPYREHTTLILRGGLHRPILPTYPRAEIRLSGRAVLPEPWLQGPPQSLGTLDARGDCLQGYATLPLERVTLLAAAAPRIRLVALTATRLYRRKGSVCGLHVDTAFDPEEW